MPGLASSRSYIPWLTNCSQCFGSFLFWRCLITKGSVSYLSSLGFIHFPFGAWTVPLEPKANESNGKKKSRRLKAGGIRRRWKRQAETELHKNNRGWSKRGLDLCRGWLSPPLVWWQMDSFSKDQIANRRRRTEEKEKEKEGGRNVGGIMVENEFRPPKQ